MSHALQGINRRLLITPNVTIFATSGGVTMVLHVRKTEITEEQQDMSPIQLAQVQGLLNWSLLSDARQIYFYIIQFAHMALIILLAVFAHILEDVHLQQSVEVLHALRTSMSDQRHLGFVHLV